MPYPSVTALPPAASRTGDPGNFAAEAQVFLGAFGTWRTQSNALATYIDAAPLNVNNWGTVVDSNPTQTTLTATTARPTTPGLAWASAQDNLWASLQSASALQNSLGAFVDAVGALTGSFSDPARPVTSAMAAAPTRGQTSAAFNASSQSFYDSVATYVANINTVGDYFYSAISPDTYGIIGDTVTATDDWGTL